MTRVPRVDAAMLETRAAVLAERSIAAEAKRAAIDIAMACVTLTVASGTTAGELRALCTRARRPAPGIPSVCAVAIEAQRVAAAAVLLAGSTVRVAAVIDEARQATDALAAGASEIDMTIGRDALGSGRYDAGAAQIAAAREACGGATLKVALDVSELGTYAAVRRACDLALDAGADFMQFTGRIGGATAPAVALLVCHAIRDRLRRGGRVLGLGFDGVLSDAKTALGVFAVVAETLGPAWLYPARLRLGGAALLDDLLLQRERIRSAAYAAPGYVATA